MNRYLASLRHAFDEGRLDEFLAEQQEKGVGHKDRAELDRALVRVIKQHQMRRRAASVFARHSRSKPGH